ncbi:uncharacterized protein FIBRA_09266 [Fibroporia radiculosa]|uniref:Uncharacterized protein n=1 Tax=Fibroporia radiculosa TaxID=599839 RepID=J7RHA0_9APHY|nr:uncharacterized protein FIBRA_09266 [Fibroporia radiculosa]CCM06952.1 predicted protein [Fibroporia radiculosa]
MMTGVSQVARIQKYGRARCVLDNPPFIIVVILIAAASLALGLASNVRMALSVCSEQSLLSFSSSCSRDFWAAVVPATFVVVLLVTAIPLPQPVRRVINAAKQPFTNFLTVAEAEALDACDNLPADTDSGNSEAPPVPLWRIPIVYCEHQSA